MKTRTFFILISILLLAGCNKRPDNEERFCSFVNVENIDKTIPIVNEFLSGLSADLDDEQQLQELVLFLRSCPCITVLSQLTYRMRSEIVFAFDENETTQRLIMDVSMGKPLKVTGCREYEECEECEEVPYKPCPCENNDKPDAPIKGEAQLYFDPEGDEVQPYVRRMISYSNNYAFLDVYGSDIRSPRTISCTYNWIYM